LPNRRRRRDRISMRTAFICVTFAVTSPQERIYISAGVTRRLFGFQPKGWCLSRSGNRSAHFAIISLWGKFGGLHTCAATFSYIVPLPNIFLTRLFSKLRLKRKDFQEILRLPWAQEAPGSNPGAPTIYFIEYRASCEISSLPFSKIESMRQATGTTNLPLKKSI